MIQVSNLEKAHGKQVLFDKVGFTINSGERIGLVGRNGHGKTTLFRMILGEEHPDSGIISIPNDYTIGHLSQHIHFTEETVLKEGCLSLRKHEDGIDETYKVEAILMGLGFSQEDFSLSPMELSGGYQIRLNLAKVLVLEPNLLLLDEPTNYLDIISIRWLEQFLRKWKNELIVITHDREFMDSVTTHTMAIHRCKMRKIKGSVQKLYEQILLEEEVHEQTRLNEDKKRSEVEQFINRFRAQANRASAVQSRIKSLQRKEKLEKISKIKNLDFEFNSAPFTGKLLLEADDIAFSFSPEDQLLIDGLSLSVAKSDRIAIIGKNGKGKTTLLNLLAGELQPVRGNINQSPRLKLAYFGQTNISRLDPQKTVEEEILEVLPEFNRRKARNICGSMMFDGDKALKKVSVLSGGEKSRVLLGKLLATPANLLLLDEPTNHLDMESIDSLIEAIEVFDGAVIIVTHSERMLHAAATRLIVFDDGRVDIFEGTYQDFLDRVGWKNESQGKNNDGNAEDNQKGAKNTPAKGLNKKDLRRMRAELATSRSKVLSALQKEITGVEDAITKLEQQIERITQDLLAASVKGDGDAIKTLSKALHDSKLKLDKLFEELGTLNDELESKAQAFEDKLNELSGSVSIPA